MALTVEGFGPFLKGVVDGANTAVDLKGFLKWARHAALSGVGRMLAGPGSAVAITLKDDQGAPATCTSVLEIVPFGDGCLAVAYSSVTQKVYLYRLDSSLTGYWNLAGTVFTVSANALPIGVLWTGVLTPPAVTISEILGEAWIAHNAALTSTTLDWPTKSFNGTAINSVTADIDGAAGAETIYALGTFVFQGHRWIWGFDKGAAAAAAYRPELLRFGGPDGGLLTDDGKGSFTVGHRIRSAREAIVGACVAGEVAYIGTTFSLWPIVGYGRDSWDKSRPLDDSYGFVSLKGQVSANGVLYYWSPRGPCRVSGLNKPEPLWDALPETIPAIVDPEKIVAGFDIDRDQVCWYYRGGTKTGNQLVAAYDIRRECFLGPDTDQGFAVGAAGLVAPVTAPAAAGAAPPAAPPSTPSTSSIGSTSAIANWVNGDTNPDVTTVIEYRQSGATTWQPVTTVGAGVTHTTITGLGLGTPYEWRANHVRNSQASAYLGPVAGTQFTTVDTLAPPTNVTLSDSGPGPRDQAYIEWVNSGESGVSTYILLTGVSDSTGNPTTPRSKTVGVGVSSAQLTISENGQYTATVRHFRSGSTDSPETASALTPLSFSEWF